MCNDQRCVHALRIYFSMYVFMCASSLSAERELTYIPYDNEAID